jgi:hypothetical protein
VAARLLAGTAITEPWERQVAACLALMCAEEDATDCDVANATARCFLSSHRVAGYAVYRARLGLTVTTLTRSKEIADKTAAGAITSADAYAARDVLTHPEVGILLSPDDRRRLVGLVTSSALNAGTIPERLRGELIAAVSTAEGRLRKALVLEADQVDAGP